MQQTESIASSTPTDLSPSFQDWLSNEKAAARRHRAGLLKWAAFFVAIIGILLLKDQGVLLQELFNHTTVIAQP